MSNRKLGSFIQQLILAAAAPLLAYCIARQLLGRLDPEAGAKAEAQQKALAATQRLQNIFNRPQDDDDDDDDEKHYDSDSSSTTSTPIPPRAPLNLTPYEQTIALSVISPSSIPTGFTSIGGLDSTILELRESVIYPLTLPHLFSRHSSLLTAPSGVLLYGPPGCGKTMLAKALAKESSACFINLHISTLTEKWYGDSNKLVAAVFSLARKLQPAIVFIDEIDAVLGKRSSGEHEASGMVKAEFMTHWDGLLSSTAEGEAQRIVVLGATNRIQEIDDAILRRLPKRFHVPLPGDAQRREILELTLRGTRLEEEGDFDWDALVNATKGMSGSEIKEICRDAAMVPVREYVRSLGGDLRKKVKADDVRGLRITDFFAKRVDGNETEEVDEFE
ncbi:AAA-domain-containing protein [Piedraia hortae CBS 480.64]|uniref:AAA-domain-containing protein n=1 Tax=Piedraia hortae CBS 480.64 TaxID=1314780 RepID=A0A6A7CBZ7_9PEZI|nr:AAA-domain-containing protein [Piedraia hortae CBS 480.64]